MHAQLDIGAQHNALTRVIVSSARAEAVRIRAARVRECKHHTPRNCGRKELAEPRKETEKAAEPAHARPRSCCEEVPIDGGTGDWDIEANLH